MQMQRAKTSSPMVWISPYHSARDCRTHPQQATNTHNRECAAKQSSNLVLLVASICTEFFLHFRSFDRHTSHSIRSRLHLHFLFNPIIPISHNQTHTSPKSSLPAWGFLIAPELSDAVEHSNKLSFLKYP